MILNEQIRKTILEQIPMMQENGQLPSPEKLASYYQLFRDKFGTEKLAALDGEALLSLMHDSSNHDSLVYWLEFKNDDEFPGRFGSIAGGSALKFGIYKRSETGNWMTGSPEKQVVLSVEDSIKIARKHRDQFASGCKLLEDFPENATDADYADLENQLKVVSPDVYDTSWGHKYFYLMFPTILDDFHSPYYQRYHLMRMLQLPVTTEGRYSAAGQFIASAKELNLPLNHLTRILVELFGSPYKYWAIRVNFTGYQKEWDIMKENGYVAIGWNLLGDLSELKYETESRNKLKSLMLEKYNEKGGFAQEIFNFVTKIEKGDVILAIEKSEQVLGIGKVVGDYYYVSGDQYPNRKKVDWYSRDSWEMPFAEIKNRTIKQIFVPKNIVETESRLFGTFTIQREKPGERKTIETLTGTALRIREILDRKSQVILYGPPGTGKTYWAFKAITEMASMDNFDKPFNELDDRQKAVILGDKQNRGLVRFCTFHPSYGYEDFIEGYRPNSLDGVLVFQLKSGIFKKLCTDAFAQPNKKFYLIIDEINRGDIPRIFGELLTIMEKDKRGKSIYLPVSEEYFSVPDNVYLVGTMNTADRSIALLDTALRRRFGFIELMPDSKQLGNTVLNDIPLAAWLEGLNNRILTSIGRDARNLQVGHAYFLENGRPISDFSKFVRILREDIIPLLEEYCYEDYEALEKILGKSLVDCENQKIRLELFDDNRREDLILAFLSPELTTSSAILQHENLEEMSEKDTEEQD